MRILGAVNHNEYVPRMRGRQLSQSDGDAQAYIEIDSKLARSAFLINSDESERAREREREADLKRRVA